jgi:hypothetical protein
VPLGHGLERDCEIEADDPPDAEGIVHDRDTLEALSPVDEAFQAPADQAGFAKLSL